MEREQTEPGVDGGDAPRQWAIHPWSRDRSGELAALVAAALPGEDLSEDELLAVSWDDPDPEATAGEVGIVVGSTDGSGVAAAVIRVWGDGPHAARIGFLKLIAVHPDARRQGLGHALMAGIEAWAWEQGASELHLAGSAPFYLWPGVDATATEMLCLIESRKYELMGSDVNMTLPTTFRAGPPERTSVRRVIDDADVDAVHAFVDTHWPQWWAETERAIEHGCCHAVFADTDDGGDHGGDAPTVIGFGCHSVNRAGWLGPMGTDPDRRAGGVGRALLSEICRDLMIAEFTHTEISWVGPARFYAKSGATISRVFRSYRTRRPAAG